MDDERRRLKRKLLLTATMAASQVMLFLQQHVIPELVSDDDLTSSDDELPKIKRRRRQSWEMPVIQTFIPEIVHKYNDVEFQAHFRLSRGAFQWLMSHIGNHLRTLEYGRPCTDVEKQLLAILWLLATPDSFRSVASRFGLSKGTLHSCFKRVVKALNWLCPKVVKWPGAEERVCVKTALQKLGGLNGVVGIIDGTYVRIKAPHKNAEVYVNRKCFYGVTLQGICDDRRRFINAFAGYPSSVSDIRIFRNSFIYKKIISQPDRYFSPHEFLIGDKAYETKTFCVPPYKEGRNFLPWQRQFNQRHAKTRQVIERTFALFFGRFRRFKDLDMSRTNWIPYTLMAGVALHNICLLHPADDMRDLFEAEGAKFSNERNVEDPGMRDTVAPAISVYSNDAGKQFRDQLAEEMGLLNTHDDSSPEEQLEDSNEDVEEVAGQPENRYIRPAENYVYLSD